MPRSQEGGINEGRTTRSATDGPVHLVPVPMLSKGLPPPHVRFGPEVREAARRRLPWLVSFPPGLAEHPIEGPPRPVDTAMVRGGREAGMEDEFILAMRVGGMEWREKQRDGAGVADGPHEWAVRLSLQIQSYAYRYLRPSHTLAHHPPSEAKTPIAGC